MNKLYRNNRKMYYKAFAGCMYKKARILNILRNDMKYYKKTNIMYWYKCKRKRRIKK